MTMLAGQARAHGALMDAIYRRQVRIYDITRKYYLFGRDRLIRGLDAAPGARVLELGCGTGRNLAMIARRWPGMRLFGIDISREMLGTAQARLGNGARLALADASAFDAAALLGTARFDRIVISFALSMIPPWQQTVAHAATLLAPGGSLHIVDFHDAAGLPGPLRRLLQAWLTRFHVTPRTELAKLAQDIATQHGLSCQTHTGAFGYYRLIVLTRSR
ncbi:UNVERIFIED_ORG: S-adenosylmethionine-diacylgycerolhomoserine-N-methyltransferase [Sphingomonas sp. R1F5B]